jgi:hypothetical protein
MSVFKLHSIPALLQHQPLQNYGQQKNAVKFIRTANILVTFMSSSTLTQGWSIGITEFMTYKGKMW